VFSPISPDPPQIVSEDENLSRNFNHEISFWPCAKTAFAETPEQIRQSPVWNKS